MPSLAGDEELRKFYGRLERASASPAAARTLLLISHGTDVRFSFIEIHRVLRDDDSVEMSLSDGSKSAI